MRRNSQLGAPSRAVGVRFTLESGSLQTALNFPANAAKFPAAFPAKSTHYQRHRSTKHLILYMFIMTISRRAGLFCEKIPASMSPEDYEKFLAVTLGNAAELSRDGAIHFVCTDWRRLAPNEAVAPDAMDRASLRVTIPTRLQLRGGRRWITSPDGNHRLSAPRIDPVLVQALRTAHAMLSARTGAPLGFVEAARLNQAPANRYERKLIRRGGSSCPQRMTSADRPCRPPSQAPDAAGRCRQHLWRAPEP
jgi:hypothetical protein